MKRASLLSRLRPRLAAVAVATMLVSASAQAQSIIDEWNSVKLPAAPALKEVKPDPKTTALLMLDFLNQNCGVRPRCVASLPKAAGLLAQARQRGMLVLHSLTPGRTTGDIMPAVAALPDEPNVTSMANKFAGTDLQKILAARGIKTVIVVGTAAHGAVLATGSHAATHGYDVIVPVDGMSMDPFVEAYTAWHFANAPTVSQRSTLTRSDMVRF